MGIDRIGNSDLMTDMEDQQYVDTPAMFEADNVLQDTGHVVLCGPPGCGKTTLARALLRRCSHQGFEPHTLRQAEEWDSHVGEGRRSVVLLDGTWGEVRVDRQQHACWKQILDTALTLVRKGTLRLVVTVYPHVLRELRQLDKGFQSPLHDDSATVYLTDALADSVKEQLLMFHLTKVRIEADRHREIVQNILQTDACGSVFPWCCDHMANHWDALEDPTAIFSVPAEAHSRLLKEMVLHKPDGRRFAAVFALTMAGLSDFPNRPSKTDRHLQDLGFTEFCCDEMASCAHILQGSVLAEGQFASRVLYEAAGLALGRFFSLPVLLKVCDCPFLVQFVAMTAAGCVTVRSVPCCSNNTQQCALDRQSLVERIYTEIVQGNLQYICQHPCLHSAEFLQELDSYCAKDGKRTKLLLDAVDSMHRLPLLYWSAFHPSTHLTHWCLSKAQAGNKLATEVLLAHFLFDHIAQNSGSKPLPFFHSQLTPEVFEDSDCTMSFPFVERDQSVTKEMKRYADIITGAGSVQGRLLYLSKASLPIPADVVTVQVTCDLLQLQVKDRGQWYVVYRLLTDRDVNQADRDGHSLLHTALTTGGPAAVRLCLEAGAVITQRNKQGVTPYQLAHTTRSLAAERLHSYF